MIEQAWQIHKVFKLNWSWSRGNEFHFLTMIEQVLQMHKVFKLVWSWARRNSFLLDRDWASLTNAQGFQGCLIMVKGKFNRSYSLNEFTRIARMTRKLKIRVSYCQKFKSTDSNVHDQCWAFSLNGNERTDGKTYSDYSADSSVVQDYSTDPRVVQCLKTKLIEKICMSLVGECHQLVIQTYKSYK